MLDPFGRKAIERLQAEVGRVRATNAEHLSHTNELTESVGLLERELAAVRSERDRLKETLRQNDETMKALAADVNRLVTAAYLEITGTPGATEPCESPSAESSAS